MLIRRLQDPYRYTIKLDVLRQSVQRVSGAYLRVTAPGQHSSFQNITLMATSWQRCVRFGGLRFESQTCPTVDERTSYRSTNWPR